MPQITIEVDSQVYSAEVPMGATLRQFLKNVGVELEPEALLFDGQRVLSAHLEMAFRHQSGKLRTEIPQEFLREVAALTPESLMVGADR